MKNTDALIIAYLAPIFAYYPDETHRVIALVLAELAIYLSQFDDD